MPMLTAKRVVEILTGCLFSDDENIKEYVKAGSIMHTFAFDPGKLRQYKDEIIMLLNELPEGFKAEVGGGQSFLNACVDKHGNHWAEHPTMDALFSLGIAIGKVTVPFPRKMWRSLPGGVPYYIILSECKEMEITQGSPVPPIPPKSTTETQTLIKKTEKTIEEPSKKGEDQ
jgi:hypothetical protein